MKCVHEFLNFEVSLWESSIFGCIQAVKTSFKLDCKHYTSKNTFGDTSQIFTFRITPY